MVQKKKELHGFWFFIITIRKVAALAVSWHVGWLLAWCHLVDN